MAKESQKGGRGSGIPIKTTSILRKKFSEESILGRSATVAICISIPVRRAGVPKGSKRGSGEFNILLLLLPRIWICEARLYMCSVKYIPADTQSK